MPDVQTNPFNSTQQPPLQGQVGYQAPQSPFVFKSQNQAGPIETILAGFGGWLMCWAYGQALISYFSTTPMVYVGLILSAIVGHWGAKIIKGMVAQKSGSAVEAAVSLGGIIGLVMSPALVPFTELTGHLTAGNFNLLTYLPTVVLVFAIGIFYNNLRSVNRYAF